MGTQWPITPDAKLVPLLPPLALPPPHAALLTPSPPPEPPLVLIRSAGQPAPRRLESHPPSPTNHQPTPSGPSLPAQLPPAPPPSLPPLPPPPPPFTPCTEPLTK